AGPAELRRPPVGPTRGRVRGSELCHREPYEQYESAEDRPTERDPRRPAGGPREREVRKDSRENRDDREGDREVREAAPRARDLLSGSRPRGSLLGAPEGPLLSHPHASNWG